MEDLTQLHIVDLAFQYGIAIEDYNKAYAKKKSYEDEFKRRFEAKQRESIRTHGVNGTYQQLNKERESCDGIN